MDAATYKIHRHLPDQTFVVTPVADAITDFCRPEDLPKLVAQYGSLENLALANFSAFTEDNPGDFALRRSNAQPPIAAPCVIATGTTGLLRT